MGCNVSKDVKVEDQGNTDALKNGEGMSEEKAAEKIQASFRGYKARKSLKNNGLLPSTKEDQKIKKSSDGTEENRVQDPQDEMVDIDLTDKDVLKAAYKIQNSYRKFTKRKKVQDKPDSETIQESEQNHQVETKPEKNEVEDINLEDPDVEKAALKIQSTFRGYKVRKDINPSQDGE